MPAHLQDTNLTGLTDGKSKIRRHTHAYRFTHRGRIIDATTLTTRMTPAWIVYAWPPVLWQASSASNLHLVHLGTRVLTFGDEAGPCSGQTLWGDASVDRSAGVAWDWVELQQGVVAMADPFGMVTNLRLIDAHGEALSHVQVTVHLHQLVHALPWQTEVQRALSKPS
jgi:hypothetical protein